MSLRTWPLALALAACAPAADDDTTDDTNETDTSDDTDGGDDTDAGGDTDGGSEDTEDPAPTDWYGLAGRWSGSLDVRYVVSIPRPDDVPTVIDRRCPSGTIELDVDPVATPSVVIWVSHTCDEIDLGTVTITSDFSRDGSDTPILSEGMVSVSGTIGASELGEGTVPWVGTFTDTDDDGDVDTFGVFREGSVPNPIGQANLTIDISTTRTGDLD